MRNNNSIMATVTTPVATIYIDHRENAMERGSSGGTGKRSPVSYFEQVVDASNRKHSKKSASNGGGLITYEIREVPRGDYCIVLRGGILAALIERKEWKDLAASITDGRADGQSHGLKEAKLEYGCKVYFLAEGNFAYKDDTKVGGKHGMNFSALHSKLRHEMLRGVPFIQSKDPEHTAQLIVKIARDLIQLHTRKEITFPLQSYTGTKDIRLAQAYITSVRKLNEKFSKLACDIDTDTDTDSNIHTLINDVNAYIEFADCEDVFTVPDTTITTTDLPKSFSKRRVAGDADIVASIWTAVPGVTVNSAGIISQHYHISQLFNAVEDPDALNTLESDIGKLKFPSRNSIGKQSAKIIGNFRTQDKAQATGVRVLSAIPGVSTTAAENIVSTYNMQNLCDPSIVNADDLASVLRSGKLKIGPKLAQKILSFIQSQP